jgi:glycosyltransferase involved in cell wall biosynthesis
MRLSLIVPVYKAEGDLPFLFASLDHQTRPFDEVFFIDNGSKDASFKICKKYAGTNPAGRAKVLIENTPGPGPARNRGINEAQGDIVCFTDSDCVLDPSFAENVEKFFSQNAYIDIISGTALVKSPVPEAAHPLSAAEEFSLLFWSEERSSASCFPLDSKSDYLSGAPFYITTYNMACRKKVLDDLGGFHSMMTMEDIDFWLRACGKGFRSLAGVPEVKVFHRNRTTVSGLAKQYYHYIHSLPWVLKNHFPGRFATLYQMKILFSFRFITGVLEINPHTFLLLVLLIKSSFFLPAVLILAIYKYTAMAMRLRRAGKAWPLNALVFALIMEVRRLAMTAGAIAGSIKHKTICLL